MADLFAFISPDALAANTDPTPVMKTATSLAALLADLSYNPDAGGLWALGKIDPPSQTVQVVNQATGLAEPAAVCGLER